MTQTSTTQSTSPAPSPLSQLFAAGRDIKLSHTVFALPFALLAMYIAAASIERFPLTSEFALVVACMFFARSAAMLSNRLLDMKIDAANPRTAGRAIPAGKLSAPFARLLILVCAVAFFISAAGFYYLHNNPWPLYLSPLVFIYLGFYSLTKRFTWLCHLYLGSSLAISPLAAALAIQPTSLFLPELWCLAAMVACWVAGFDIIYALQDVEFDKDNNIFSMPASLGVENALMCSRWLHATALFCLTTSIYFSHTLSLYFMIAAALTATLLLLEHTLVWKSKTNHIHHAFLTINGLISILLGAAGIVDILFALN
ncbi:UbiA-like polyprenyltransferase [Poriferisphaera sp. WC338]|uniref:UbiA-like polyprenyltransferase n=1 Tax=Poriferisphaera sp. WC338 TaxID=3425129 RepID=UPI003D815C83